MKRTRTRLYACVAALAMAASAAAQGPGEASADGTGLFARTSPSVMLLTAFDANGTPLRQGSAFVVDASGTLVTTNDVVGDAAIVEVRAPDGRNHAASALIASDPASNLALLRMEASGYPALSLADGDPPAVGTAVHVVGTAVQLRNALFSGVVSGTRPAAAAGAALMLEISNQLFPVTSGAPLLGNDGLVLGVAIFAAEPPREANLAASVIALRALLARAQDAPARPLGVLSSEMRERIEGASTLRTKILSECTPTDIVNTDRVIRETLNVGTPLDDTGNQRAAFRLYEGASYKLLYLLGERCPSASAALNEALADSARDDAAGRKAAVLRYAFDAILGVPAEGQDAPGA
jgi:S1-C subfamily serine protease